MSNKYRDSDGDFSFKEEFKDEKGGSNSLIVSSADGAGGDDIGFCIDYSVDNGDFGYGEMTSVIIDKEAAIDLIEYLSNKLGLKQPTL